MAALLRRRGVEAVRRGAAFDPFTLPGGGTWAICSWAEDPSWTPPSNGSPVSSWRNGGTAGTAFTASSTARPTYTAADANLNGRPSLTFDGTDDAMFMSGVTVAQPDTIVIVGYAGGSTRRFIDGTTQRQFIGTSGGFWTIFAGSTVTTDLAGNGSKHVLVVDFNGASSTFRQDGVAASAFATPGANGLNLAGSTGGLGKSGTNFMPGGIAFVGISSGVLGSTDKTYLEAGFKALYATP